ncbi:hypothetical protein ACH5RR_021476 [Cinchona calisaya]|uniref:Uncharacterized protein n=1 Tax=Cinchona calisaya TaxID=153742 RepID=A0ABD2ZKA5_9GENT
MRFPSDLHSIFAIDVIDSIMQKVFDFKSDDGIEVAITEHLLMDDLKDPKGKLALKEHVEEALAILVSLSLLTSRNHTYYGNIDVWGINTSMLLAVDYVSKYVEDKATRNNDFKP